MAMNLPAFIDTGWIFKSRISSLRFYVLNILPASATSAKYGVVSLFKEVLSLKYTNNGSKLFKSL